MGPLVDQRSPGSFADTLQRDPEAWALRISAKWQASIDAYIQTGHLLLQAKAALPHGAFTSLLQGSLPFSINTAQRLMAIARDERISNLARAQLLPASWTTAYEITKLSDEQLEDAVSRKIIHPEMERNEVIALVRPEIPEPAESGDPDQTAAGGVLIPSMAAEQSGELDAGETTESGASGSLSPALLAPVDPAADEGAGSDASAHAPPAVLPGGGLAIAHSRVEAMGGLDFFPTPLWSTRALFEHVLKHLNRLGHCKYQSVLEPACGEGHMAEVLKEYFPMVIATDVKDYGRGYGVADFLDKDTWTNSDWIITNPPFNISTEFVLKAIELAGTGVAMFVRLSWLESSGRYERIFRDQPPSQVAIFSERVPLHKGRWEVGGSTMTAYIWLVWVKGMPPQPPFWIPPGCRDALTKPDDASRFGAPEASEATE